MEYLSSARRYCTDTSASARLYCTNTSAYRYYTDTEKYVTMDDDGNLAWKTGKWGETSEQYGWKYNSVKNIKIKNRQSLPPPNNAQRNVRLRQLIKETNAFLTAGSQFTNTGNPHNASSSTPSSDYDDMVINNLCESTQKLIDMGEQLAKQHRMSRIGWGFDRFRNNDIQTFNKHVDQSVTTFFETTKAASGLSEAWIALKKNPDIIKKTKIWNQLRRGTLKNTKPYEVNGHGYKASHELLCRLRQQNSSIAASCTEATETSNALKLFYEEQPSSYPTSSPESCPTSCAESSSSPASTTNYTL